MKANLIENLIVSHCTGDESKFSDAVYELIKDEEKKVMFLWLHALEKHMKPSKNKSEPEFL